MRHYPRNIGDLAAATRGLDLLHRGAYDALLDAYYLREAPLPLDPRECYLLADARSNAERRAVNAVLDRFFQREDDGYHQKRCDAELGRFHEKSDKARRSADARWTHTEVDANAMRTHTKRNANASETHGIRNATQDPRTKNQENTTVEIVERARAASPPTTSRKARLPADWQLPKPWGEWAQAERGWPADEVRRVAALFADHWRGKGEARADWLATWRNWVRRESSSTKPRADARTESRNAFAASILGDVGHDQQTAEHSDPRDISGEAVRVA